MAYNIRLMNMPFAGLNRPSIALSQLKYVIEEEFCDKVDVKICYANHVLSNLFGVDKYNIITHSDLSHVTGLGDWVFRDAAFPEAGGDRAAYLARSKHQLGKEMYDWLTTEFRPLHENMNHKLDGLIEKFDLLSADIVGFTSMFAQTTASIAVARRLKLLKPEIIVVMGGANCEGTMGVEMISNVDVLDFVFSGYALKSFPEFLRNVLSGDIDKCHSIGGVLSRKNTRSVKGTVNQKDRKYFATVSSDSFVEGISSMGKENDINQYIALNYDDYFESCLENFDRVLSDTVLPFETSRGCWWGARSHCTFCGLNGTSMAYKAMAPDLALATIRSLMQKYAGRVAEYSAVDNIVPLEYFETVFPNLAPPTDGAIFFYEVKADLSEDQVEKLAKSGVSLIQPGIESLATSTLKLMRKGTTAFHNIRLLTNCLTHGVMPSWNLLIGFPGEKREVYDEYLRVLPDLIHLPPPTGVYPVRFDRFSPYFTKMEEYGLKLEPYAYYKSIYPFPPEVLMNFAYYFRDTNYDAEYMEDAAQALGPLREVVSEWTDAWSQGPASAPKLELILDKGSFFVSDARKGRDPLFRVTAEQCELLRELIVPRDEVSVERKFGDNLSLLEGKGLIFRERGRVVGLIPALSRVLDRQAMAVESA